jgi:hypothetical protein
MNTSPNLDEILKILHAHLPALKEKYPIASLALFGSIVREDFDASKSDIDVLVKFNDVIGIRFFDLTEDLEKMIGRKIDLVSIDGLKKPWWKEHVLKQAIYV